MDSKKDLPLRIKHRTSLKSSSILSKSLSPDNLEGPSSAESITTLETVWDDSPVPLRFPPSSPITPPCDEEKSWELGTSQLGPSPLVDRKIRHLSHSRPTRPLLRRSGTKRPLEIGPDGILADSGNTKHNDEAIYGAIRKPNEGTKCDNSSSDSGDECASGRPNSASSNFEEHRISSTKEHQLITSPISTKSKREVLKLKQSNDEYFEAVAEIDSTKVERETRGDCRSAKLSVPGGWNSENDTFRQSSAFPEDEYDPECSTLDRSSQTLSKTMPGNKTVERPPINRVRHNRPISGHTDQITLSTPNKRIGWRSNYSNPRPPLFAPYHKDPIDVDQILFRIFGGVDDQKAGKARRNSKTGSDDFEETYWPWIISQEDKPPVGDGYGYIYMYKSHHCPGYIKIGMTTLPVERRIRKWKTQCGLDIQIIEQPDDKPLYNFDLVEQIIHIELWKERRKFECGVCSAKHQNPLRNTVILAKNPKKVYDKHVSHGEWFKIEEERAIEVAQNWRRWMAPDGVFPAAPYGRDRRLTRLWVRRYHSLSSDFQHIDWERWRKPPGWLELGLDFCGFVVEGTKSTYSESSHLGFSIRAVIFWVEKVIKYCFELSLFLLPLIVVLFCWGCTKNLWGLFLGMLLVLLCFGFRWLRELR